jgi:hypothetical protein
VGFSEALLLFHVTHFRISMVGVKEVSEDSDGSDEAPSPGETPFPSLGGFFLSWGFSRVTGNPYIFRHCLDGRSRDDGDGRSAVLCDSVSSCVRDVGAMVQRVRGTTTPLQSQQ